MCQISLGRSIPADRALGRVLHPRLEDKPAKVVHLVNVVQPVKVVHLVRATSVAISDTAVEQTRHIYVIQGQIQAVAKARFWLWLSSEDNESCPLRSAGGVG